MKTIIVSAYSVNPFEGSEGGTGWNIVNELSKENKLIVVTRKNNLPEIERYMETNLADNHTNLEFHGYDLPNPIMKWKKRLGERGYVLYFYLWQLFLPFFIKKEGFKFDLAHALNFHSDSHPTFLWVFRKPTIWGPVGHHPLVPTQFIRKQYGTSSFIKDRLYYGVKWVMRNLDPFYYLSKFMVSKIFVINSSIPKAMGVKKSKTEILPAVASETISNLKIAVKKEFIILSVGRFHYMKGFDVAIRSFAQFHNTLSSIDKSKTKLQLVGKGPEENNLKAIIKELDIEAHVEIINWVDKSEMDAIYRKASVYLFPSHEGAGMVIPEAQSYGIPTITFDNVGPGELAGKSALKVSYDNYDFTIQGFSNQLKRLYSNSDFFLKQSNLALQNFSDHFTWASKAKVINKTYQDLVPQKSIAVFHPSSELYGADRILVNALEALPKDIRKVVYLKFQGPLVDFIAEHVENTIVKVTPHMPVIYRAIFSPSGIIKFGYDWLRFANYFISENRKYKFISGYVNTLSTSFISPILKSIGVIHFTHVHEIIETPKLIGKLTAWIGYLFSSKMICVSNAVKDNLINYLPALKDKSIVLHNGIDALSVKPKKTDKKINFYLFGRIMEKKGQWFLIEALKQISQEVRENISIVLMGGAVPGKEEQLSVLKAEINKNNLSETVIIKGFEKSIDKAMEKADVCLVPSMMKDPFPTTVLEAMSAGKPVIATNHGGAKEALNGSNCGLLVNPGNVNELAASITQMVEQKSRINTMGDAARKRFKANYTKEHFDNKWLEMNLNGKFI
ncbi:MAG: glycosyltransferase family 4 protein [Salibacteraceae bacterium]